MSTGSEEVVRRELGRRIAKLRVDQGMTQGDLAGRVGVTRSCLGHWERGFHAPSLAQLIDLRQALQTSLDLLILGPEHLAGFSSAQLERMARHLKGLSERNASAGVNGPRRRQVSAMQVPAPIPARG